MAALLKDTISFTGDVFAPSQVKGELDLGELCVFNCEGVIGGQGLEPWPGKVNLRASSSHIRGIFGDRHLVACLANNHCMDFGTDGLRSTVDALDADGIRSYGAGLEADNFANPLVLRTGDTTVAFMGYVATDAHPVFGSKKHAGVAPIDLARIRTDLAEAERQGASIRVVSLHFGIEEVSLPRPTDVALARRIVDLGADAVIGHHAHCMQPWEVYQGVPVCYGLGNLVFPDLDIPAFFSEDRESWVRFRKRQRWWNRASMIANFHIPSQSLTVARALFGGDAVLSKSHKTLEPTQMLGTPEYERVFNRRHYRDLWRMKILGYLAFPVRPELRHLRSLLAINHEARTRS